MLLSDLGSVGLKVPEGSVIVYQHMLHQLKAISSVQPQMPITLKGLRKK